MQSTHIGGVDPGLVHTGCVSIQFLPSNRTIVVQHEAVVGPDAAAVQRWLNQLHIPHDHVWIEDFRDRGNLSSNKQMHTAVANLRKATRGTVLSNMGIKKVITDDLLKLLGCWKFSTVTNHQDLRSAARIALLGYAKTEHGNLVLADVVGDHLDGKTWSVRHY